jgi:hypothetical protein
MRGTRSVAWPADCRGKALARTKRQIRKFIIALSAAAGLLTFSAAAAQATCPA